MGATLDIVGRVWSPPERDDEGALSFVMIVDPKNSEWEALVSFPASSPKDFGQDDYVRVKGTVRETWTGESGEVPLILANSVSRVD